MNRRGKYIALIIFLSQLLIPRIYAVGSKLLNPEEVFFRGILFYIFCVGGNDVDIRRYLWEDLFQKSSVDGAENLCVSNSDRKKTISIEIYKKSEKAKK